MPPLLGLCFLFKKHLDIFRCEFNGFWLDPPLTTPILGLNLLYLPHSPMSSSSSSLFVHVSVCARAHMRIVYKLYSLGTKCTLHSVLFCLWHISVFDFVNKNCYPQNILLKVFVSVFMKDTSL